MLNKIRGLMGNSSGDTAQQDTFARLNAIAPLKAGAPSAGEAATDKAQSFVCREAVLSRKERIAGYEFALGHKLQSRMLEKSALIRRVYDDAMLRNLTPLGVSSLLGERFSLIRLSVFSLKNPLLHAYAGTNTYIMIAPDWIADSDLAEVRRNLQHLEAKGIKYGWTLNRPRPELDEFLQGADFIEIDAAAFDGIQIKSLCLDFRSMKGNKQLIASALQTSDDFNLCFHCGFHYFMGPFVSSRENWHPAKSEINRQRVFEALNMIRTGAEFNTIADCLRTDPVLTYKLLRYINSPGIGLQNKINEISQALLILGRERFFRWLSLLLFDFNQAGYRELVLNEQALTRARFMEMLAGQGHIPREADQLFITGLFSLLDVMLGQPIADILQKVALPEAVAAALKGEPGVIRDALLLGIAVETDDQEAMAAAAAQCGLDAQAITALMLDALAWSQQLITASTETDAA